MIPGVTPRNATSNGLYELSLSTDHVGTLIKAIFAKLHNFAAKQNSYNIFILITLFYLLHKLIPENNQSIY
jgi:hypothetical protein